MENYEIKSKVKVNFYFKISSIVTLQFIKVLKENKERKYLRGSGEIAKKKRDWKKSRGNGATGRTFMKTYNWVDAYRSNLRSYP